ncbi:DNA topoisomerase [Vibrio parahaemolyticus]|uniref:DNA topoisomerase n=1 Tax=Vibrio parahaemolyticus TaxID=670 RepID=UPI0021E17001|nr:DNA topoisomerase [Vibrio parahaemolyticus]
MPTEKSGAGIELNERERNLYELVAKRFIALFYPGSVRDKVALDVTCTGRCYRATQTTLNKQGWEVLFKGETSRRTQPKRAGFGQFNQGHRRDMYSSGHGAARNQTAKIF